VGLRGGFGLVVVAWYLLASSCALFDVIDGIERLVPSSTSQRAVNAAEGFRCAHHDCGCANSEACRRRCCCEDEATPRRPDAARSSATIHFLSALACHGGSNGGVTVVPMLDPAVVASFSLVIPPRLPATVVVHAASHAPALDGNALDKVPIATA
jgi:hypothetical protein